MRKKLFPLSYTTLLPRKPVSWLLTAELKNSLNVRFPDYNDQLD